MKHILLCSVIGLAGCANQIQVVSREHTQTVAKSDGEFFLRGPATDTRLTTEPLPATQRGQEFFVSWPQTSVDTVKFEYRQASVPNKVQEQTVQAGKKQSHVFLVRGESGTDVTAWRVTLLQAGAVVATRQSALW
jgi:hypothetical protein